MAVPAPVWMRRISIITRGVFLWRLSSGRGLGMMLAHHVQVLKALVQAYSRREAVLDARAHDHLALLGELGAELVGCFVDHVFVLFSRGSGESRGEY